MHWNYLDYCIRRYDICTELFLDEAEEMKKNELRNNAKKELEEWYKQRDAALKLTKEANRYSLIALLFVMNTQC